MLQREGYTQNEFEKSGNTVPTMEGEPPLFPRRAPSPPPFSAPLLRRRSRPNGATQERAFETFGFGAASLLLGAGLD